MRPASGPRVFLVLEGKESTLRPTWRYLPLCLAGNNNIWAGWMVTAIIQGSWGPDGRTAASGGDRLGGGGDVGVVANWRWPGTDGRASHSHRCFLSAFSSSAADDPGVIAFGGRCWVPDRDSMRKISHGF
jgi:hypothetical protein